MEMWMEIMKISKYIGVKTKEEEFALKIKN